MRNLYLIIGVFLLLTGCVTKPINPYPIIENVALTPDAIENISDDVMRHLKQQFAPGQTTFLLIYEAEELGAFGSSLEGSIRNAGYAIDSHPKATDGERLGYMLDELNGRVLLRVVAGTDYEINRLYTQAGEAISRVSIRSTEVD